jgi:hypothetical protein
MEKKSDIVIGTALRAFDNKQSKSSAIWILVGLGDKSVLPLGRSYQIYMCITKSIKVSKKLFKGHIISNFKNTQSYLPNSSECLPRNIISMWETLRKYGGK